MLANLHQSWKVPTPGNPGEAGLDTALHTLERGHCTPTDRVANEMTVLVLSGRGRLVIDGASQRFCAPCSLVPPVGAEYRLVNDAAEQMMLLVARARRAPARAASYKASRCAAVALTQPADA